MGMKRSKLLVLLFLCAAAVASSSCGRKGGVGHPDAGAAGTGGATGTAGTTGAAGSAGTTGVAGAAGAAGTTGVAGAAGSAGMTGAAGADGGAGGGAGAVAGTTGAAGMVRVPFKTYEVTGTWLQQPVALAQKPGQLKYSKVVITDEYLAESCSIGDYDRDGVPDVSSGRLWYQGPDFQKTHAFRSGHGALPRKGDAVEVTTGVSDDSADFPYDIDGDGWTDIINIGSDEINEIANTNPKIGTVQPHNSAVWYQNPGAALAGDPMWVAHVMSTDVRQEQHALMDMNGDGFPELLAACKGCVPATTKGYYQLDPDKPLSWTFHAVTVPYTFPFGGLGKLHGLGGGDVNGDGRPDLVERGGAWLQGTDGTWNSIVCTGRNTPAGCGWIKEKTPMLPTGFYDGVDEVGNKGGSHMYAVDMDKDGRTDVVSADWAHSWGLYWYKQELDGKFTKFQFLGEGGSTVNPDGGAPVPSPDLAKWGAGFSEPHALQVVDMDGDGRPDVVTGKARFTYPHGFADPDSDGTPYLYVFQNVAATDSRTGAPITLKPVQIDPDSTPGAVVGAPGTPSGGMGVGRQIAIGHVNTDGIMDICVATKVGLAVFLGK
jgi:FG-GAP-like repeat